MQNRIGSNKEQDVLIIANKRHGSLLRVRSPRVSYRMPSCSKALPTACFKMPKSKIRTGR